MEPVIIDSLTDGVVEKLKRAQAGIFMMPQKVELPNPVLFQCPHCGKTNRINHVLLQCWPDRKIIKGGLLVICPDCGYRQQAEYAAKRRKSRDWQKALFVLGTILTPAVLTIILLMKTGILPFETGPSGGGTDSASSASDSSTSVSSASESSEQEEKKSHYEVFQEDVTWDEAEVKCENSVYNNVSGHLAVITSQEEYDTVVSVLNAYIASHPNAENLYYVWLGAWIPDEDAANYQNTYRWITEGEEWTFDKWCYTHTEQGDLIEEPSFYDGDLIENRLILWGYQRDRLGWTFSDQNGDLPEVYPPSKGEIGYICEYEESE